MGDGKICTHGEKIVKHFRQYIVAKTPEEAVSLRQAVGSRALYIAGGTTVVARAGKSIEVLVDIGHLGLAGVIDGQEQVSIGAGTRISDLLTREVMTGVPSLYQAAGACATPVIRNMATLGGSLAGIYLPSDLAVALIAQGASVEIMNAGKRSVGIDDLLAGGWLTAYDLILAVHIPKIKRGQVSSFVKFGRSEIDIALVNVATLIDIGDDSRIKGLRISVGQTFSMPVLLKDVAREAEGKIPSLGLIQRLARSASDSVKAREDFRASAEYRKHLVKVMVARALYQAMEKAGLEIED
jgi:carbon-monoxide dehydrogenase medium subunit